MFAKNKVGQNIRLMAAFKGDMSVLKYTDRDIHNKGKVSNNTSYAKL